MYNKNIIGSALLTVLLLGSSGCGYLFGDGGVFRDKSEDYKRSPEPPRLLLPEGKSSAAMQEIYVVPAVHDGVVLSGEFEVPRPTPLVAGAGDEIIRIQKLGDDSWALVSEAPGQLWPQIRSFLTAAGIQIARVDPQQGLIETVWVHLDGQDMASRFQFRIEQGVQRGNSELHVLQMNQVGDIESWPAESHDLQQETDMLQATAQYIADSSDSTPVSMIADQAISATGKIALKENPDGHTYIMVGLPFQRAWASLARALERSTFEITDRDRSTGTYYATFNGPDSEEEDGWFDWLFDEEGHPLAGEEFVVSIESDSSSSVVIGIRQLDEGAEPLDTRQEQALLVLIKGNIN